MTLRPKAIAVPLIALLASVMASFGQSKQELVRYHELVPLGAQTFNVQAPKWHGVMALLASAESPQFEGMQATGASSKARLLASDGTPLAHYPRVVFRLTASFRSKFVENDPFHITASGDQNDYLLKLRFRIVAFHALRQSVIKPESVQMIGVPANVPYNERVYRITANLQKIPVADRVVFEVFDPSGVRLCKFHLDLM